MTRPGNLLVLGLVFAVAVAFGTATSALEPTTPIMVGEILPDGEPLLTDPMEGNLETHPLNAYGVDAYEVDAYGVDEEAEPPRVEKVPEPATVVSLAGLAAMAGGALLVRLRWFRRR